MDRRVFGSATLLSRFRALAGLEGSVTTAPPEHIPAVGALMLAYRTAGIKAVPEPVAGLKA